jgi:hypothetical protein
MRTMNRAILAGSQRRSLSEPAFSDVLASKQRVKKTIWFGIAMTVNDASYEGVICKGDGKERWHGLGDVEG